MILYAVQYNGPLTSNVWSIIRIYKDEDKAISYLNKVKNNFEDNNYTMPKLEITKIDTDSNSDYVYDYEEC
jgi:hypothetical protein